MEVKDIIEVSRSIDWHLLDREYGQTCEYIPDALAGLCSDDEEIRQRTYWKFDNNVVVQSGLYSGAFYVIPFIIQLLKDNLIHNRHNRELYDLLFELGNGYGDAETVEFSIISTPFTYFIPQKDGIQWTLTDACRDAVFMGWDVYYEELMKKDSPNRKYALELMASFYKNHIILQKSVMQQVLDSEPDSELGRLAAEYLSESYYP